MVAVALAATAAAGVASSAISSSAAGSAADKQSQSAANALAAQQAQYQQTRGDLLPFINGGQSAFGQLTNQLPQLTAPFNPTMDQLQSLPGYQFELQQGTQAAQNGFAAQGLGTSGAAMKGAANFAQGLASTDLTNYYNVYQGNLQNAYNRLLGASSLGENAAAQTGSIGQQGAQNTGNLLTGSGNAQAAGIVGGANALSGGLNNLGSLPLSYLTLQKYLGNGSTPSSATLDPYATGQIY